MNVEPGTDLIVRYENAPGGPVEIRCLGRHLGPREYVGQLYVRRRTANGAHLLHRDHGWLKVYTDVELSGFFFATLEGAEQVLLEHALVGDQP